MSDDRELTITRVFDAPRDLVFKAWTEPARLAEWWGPEGFTLPLLEIDPRPGGTWRACMRGPDGTNHWQHGVCRELVPPERLVYTLIWDSDPEHEMLLTIVFVARGQKTEMTLTQRRFKSVESRDSHRDGWSSSLNRLDAYLAS